MADALRPALSAAAEQLPAGEGTRAKLCAEGSSLYEALCVVARDAGLDSSQTAAAWRNINAANIGKWLNPAAKGKPPKPVSRLALLLWARVVNSAPTFLAAEQAEQRRAKFESELQRVKAGDSAALREAGADAGAAGAAGSEELTEAVSLSGGSSADDEQLPTVPEAGAGGPQPPRLEEQQASQGHAQSQRRLPVPLGRCG